MHRGIAVALALSCAGSVLLAETPARPTGPPFTPPEAYGSATQVLVLEAATFTPIATMTYDYFGSGYIYRTGGVDDGMWAPVNLPNGAVVDHVCVSLFDSNGVTDAYVEWGLYELGSAVNLPAFLGISNATDDYNGGYHVFCLPDAPHTVRSVTDFDGDGSRTPAPIASRSTFPGRPTRSGWGGHVLLPPAGHAGAGPGDLRRRPDEPPVLPLRRGARGCGNHRRLQR